MYRRSYLLLFTILAFKIIFHFLLVHPAYDLHRDEFLHMEQADHLAAGYLSVPPFTAFLSLLIKWLGGGVFWVRFFPALFGALTMLVIWKIVELLEGGWRAQVLAALIFLCSAMSRLNILYQPNNVDVLSWTLIFYLFVRYAKEGRPRLLLCIGLTAGLAFLNKYNILFLIAGVAPALLISQQRKIFLDKYLYGGLVIALALALPNIIWQWQHGLPVIHHMKELQATQLVNVERAGFVKEQLIFFQFGTIVWLAALVGFACYKPFKPYRFIGWTFLLVMGLFVYLHAKAYYTLGLYPVLVAFGSVYWVQLLSSGWRRAVLLASCVLILLPSLFFFTMIYPVKAPSALARSMKPADREILSRWEDGKVHALPQDFADMLGWRELADLTVQAYGRIPPGERRHTLIICDNYGQAGAINYYAGKQLCPAITFSADYMFWFPKTDILHYLIVVGVEPREYVRKYSSGYIKTGQISQPLAREFGTGVYLVQGISPLFPKKLLEWQLEEQAGTRAWK
jgi:hypothetical protein